MVLRIIVLARVACRCIIISDHAFSFASMRGERAALESAHIFLRVSFKLRVGKSAAALLASLFETRDHLLACE